jgi:hypothetical protein
MAHRAGLDPEDSLRRATELRMQDVRRAESESDAAPPESTPDS